MFKTKKDFFKLVRILSILSTVFLVVFTVLFLFTFLARTNIVCLFGAAIVYSDSMEPSIHRFDMVVFVRGVYSTGDVVVYCLNPSFCVVHRYVGDCPSNNCIVTKGDANPAPDPPVSRNMVKGVAIAVIPRLFWIPIFTFSIIYSLASVARIRIVGISSAFTYATILLFIMSIYVFVQPVPSTPTVVAPPLLYLSNALFDSNTCSIVIRYTGNIQITNATAFVLGSKFFTFFNSTHVITYPSRELVGSVYEKSGELNVSVWASINSIATLVGNYKVKVFGKPLEIEVANNSLVVRNPNCFPMHINISFQYAYGVGESWKYTNTSTIILNGFEERVLQPPAGSRFAYADIFYIVWGEKRWQRVVVRYG